MNIRPLLLLCALFASALASRADDAVTNQWFGGMLNPPGVVPVLPTNFVVVSASPESRSTKRFNMNDGNIWAPVRTARQFEYGAETKFSKAQEPMFLVHLSSQVAQYPGKGKFTIEKDLAKNVGSLGLKNAKTKKSKWGKYPVLSLTGERPNGTPVFIAWIGINSPDGWTILVDYRVPIGPGHPTVEEQQIWDDFLNLTGGGKIKSSKKH